MHDPEKEAPMRLFKHHTENTRVVDPVCGMKVDPAHAAADREFDDTTYSFCSAGCAAAFEVDPHRYVR